MTTHVRAREVLVTHIEQVWKAAFPGTPLAYENAGKVDLDAIGMQFLYVEIAFDDNERLTIDPSPITEGIGTVSFSFFLKEGCGTVPRLKAMDLLMSAMKYQELPGVTLGCPKPGRVVTKQGWTSSDLNVPFTFFH